MDDDAVADDPDLAVLLDFPFRDVTTGDTADSGNLEDLADIHGAEEVLLLDGFENPFQGLFDVLDELVDDGVVADLHLLLFGLFPGSLGGADVVGDDDGVGRGSQEDVALGDGTGGLVDDLEGDIGVLDLGQAVLDGLHGALNVGLEDQGKLLDLFLLDPVEEVVEGEASCGLVPLLIDGHLLPQQGDLLGLLDGVHHLEGVSGGGNLLEAADLDGRHHLRLLEAFALVVEEGTNPSGGASGDEGVPEGENPLLNQDRGDGTPLGVELGLQNRSLGGNPGVALEFVNLCDQEDHVQEVLYADAFLRGDGHTDGVPAVLLDDDPVLDELLFDLEKVDVRLVDLVDGDDDGNAGGLGVVDGLDGLRLDPVVGGDDQDDQVGDVGAPEPELRERFVTGGVDEDDGLVLEEDLGGSDVLGDPSVFLGGHVGVADGVQKRGLPVVDMAHDGDHRGTFAEGLLSALGLLFTNIFEDLVFEADGLALHPEEVEDHLGLFQGEALVDGVENPFGQELLENVFRLDAHLLGEVLDGHPFGDGDGSLALSLLEELLVPALPVDIRLFLRGGGGLRLGLGGGVSLLLGGGRPLLITGGVTLFLPVVFGGSALFGGSGGDGLRGRRGRSLRLHGLRLDLGRNRRFRGDGVGRLNRGFDFDPGGGLHLDLLLGRGHRRRALGSLRFRRFRLGGLNLRGGRLVSGLGLRFVDLLFLGAFRWRSGNDGVGH